MKTPSLLLLAALTAVPASAADPTNGATTVEEVVVTGRRYCDSQWLADAAVAVQKGQPVKQGYFGHKPYVKRANGASKPGRLIPVSSPVCSNLEWNYIAYLRARKVDGVQPLYDGTDIGKQIKVLQDVNAAYKVLNERIVAVLKAGEALEKADPAGLGTPDAPSKDVADYQALIVGLATGLRSDPWNKAGSDLPYAQSLPIVVDASPKLDGASAAVASPIGSETRQEIGRTAANLSAALQQPSSARRSFATASSDLGHSIADAAAANLATGLASSVGAEIGAAVGANALPVDPVQHLPAGAAVPSPVVPTTWRAAQDKDKTTFLGRIGRFFGGIWDFVRGRSDSTMDRLTRASDDVAFRTTAQKAENARVGAVTAGYDRQRAALDPSSPNYSDQVIAINNAERADVAKARQTAYQGVFAAQTPAIQARRAESLAIETKIYDDGVAAAVKELHVQFAQPAGNKSYVAQVDAYFASVWPDGQRSAAVQNCEASLGLSGEFRDLKDPTSGNVARYCGVRADLDDFLRANPPQLTSK